MAATPVLGTPRRSAEEDAVERSTATPAEPSLQLLSRMQAVHEAALQMAGPVEPGPGGISRLLARIVASAVQTLGGMAGKLVVAEDLPWQELVPGSPETEGHVTVRHTGAVQRERLRTNDDVAHVLATGDALAIVDVDAASRFGPFPLAKGRGVGSFAVVPLKSHGAILGVLVVDFARRGALPEIDRQTLDLFAAHVAAALERVRHAALERQRLATEADRARLDGALMVARTVAHELNNALTPVVGFAELLALRPPVMADPQSATYVRMIAESGATAAHTVARLQRIVRLEPADISLSDHQSVLDLERSTTPR